MDHLYVDEGDYVQKGQVIARLNAQSLQNAHEIALTALNQAQDMYDRMKKLHDSNSLSDMKWVEAQNALRSAQSAEAIARRTLGDATLTAPISGYVSKKYADAGQVVAPAVPVIKIVTIDPVKVNISVSENEIANIALGDTASISVGSLGNARFTGKVSERGVSAQPLSRSYQVKVEVPNSDHKMLPGMICDVQIVSGPTKMGIVLPSQAVLLDANNQNFVWVAYKGKAMKRVVDVDGLVDGGVIIGAGLTAGDSIIVSGQQKVSEDSPVLIANK